jgi:Cu(I)/Ag(I) efflux system periplasmic protein CusF
MNKLYIIAIASIVCAATSAWADKGHGKGQDGKATHAAQAGSAMADAEVRKVDKDAKKITLKHGEIKSLDMPPMTMVFQVKDPAMLDKVQAGDKVRFQAEKAGNSFVVTAIEVAR